MNEFVKLSIIMPCYNVGETFTRAIESILSQKVDFKYEIIIVDDCSSDNGPDLFRNYANKYKFIKIIRHEKNIGNAMSFYDGLTAAKGDYFCVLDGDDYYTVPDKLQKQVDFLDSDLNKEYVGVAHYHIIDLGNGKVYLPDQRNIKEFNYIDFLTQNSGYYHTSTYMYRNIYRGGNVPEQFKSEDFRGDTVRTAFLLMYTNKKIKVLNFVGSAYFFSYKGIWSGMKQKDQFIKQIQIWSVLRDNARSLPEQEFYNNLIDICKTKYDSVDDSYREYPAIDIEICLDRLRNYASKYAFTEKAREFIFNGIYCSEFIDTACASLGYIYRVYNPEYLQYKAYNNRIAILISVLNPNGGGIFREITEIIESYPEKEVYVIATTNGQKDNLAIDILNKYSNVKTYIIPTNTKNRFKILSTLYTTIRPGKAYYYTSHNDTYSQALMQSGVCKNIVLFSFDHGYICGLTNPNIDCIIAKRPSDFEMLKLKFKNKVIYIPTWNRTNVSHIHSYKPFNGHDKLITASSAARFYIVDGKKPYVYIDMILNLLQKTGGKHYHFGPIPEDTLDYIDNYIQNHNMPKDSFIHVPWADNLPEEMINKNIDIFIEPFPTVSYKLTLDILSYGIPVFIHESLQRMRKVDFIYSECLTWKTEEEFYIKLSSITAEELERHSYLSRKYYTENHSYEKVHDAFIEEKGFPEPEKVNVVDNLIHDVIDYLRLYSKDINSMLVRVMCQSMQNSTKSKDIKNISKTQPMQSKKIALKQRLKNLLKKILPPPTKTFMREVERIVNKIDLQKRDIVKQYNNMISESTQMITTNLEKYYNEFYLLSKILIERINYLDDVSMNIKKENILLSERFNNLHTISVNNGNLNKRCTGNINSDIKETTINELNKVTYHVRQNYTIK